MAGWRDNLLPADFRGAEFEVTEHDLNGGRRGQLNEYANRDKPFFDDTGRKARGFRVSGFVIGEDYAVKRDRLIDALEKKGPGTLTHPYLGRMQVVCQDFSVHENHRKGRMAEFSMSFVESGAIVYPSSELDDVAIVENRAEELTEAAQVSFENSYDINGSPGFVAQSIVDVVGMALDMLDVSRSFGDVQSMRDAILLNAGQNVKSATYLASSISALIAEVGKGGYQPVLGSLTQYQPDVSSVPQTTATRVNQVSGIRAVSGLVRNLSIAEYGKSIVAEEYISFQDANAAATGFVALVETEILDGPAQFDDTLYNALSAMSEAVLSAISEKSKDLARITTTSFLDSKPALVLAHEIWADATRDQEIVDRNKIEHPSFLPPNTELEILVT